MNLHATCIAIEGYGILLRGPSGSGKSDLALRLIDQYADAILVADDRVDVVVREGIVHVSAPPMIAGMLEVRGVGIAHVAYQDTACVHLLVDLVDATVLAGMGDKSPNSQKVSGNSDNKTLKVEP